MQKGSERVANESHRIVAGRYKASPRAKMGSNAGRSVAPTGEGSKRQGLANKLNRIARAIVYSPSRKGIHGARESVANTKLPDNRQLVATAQCEKESRERGRLANKSNRSARTRVDSLTGEVSERAIESEANTQLPDNQEIEAMAQHEKELREHKKSNRSARARVDSLTGEESERGRESVAKTTLQENQQGEVTYRCEKESRGCGRLAKKLNRSSRASVDSLAGEGSIRECESVSNTTLLEFQE